MLDRAVVRISMPRLAGRFADSRQLRGIPGVIQGLEFGNGRRQHLHVVAGRPDGHADRRAGGDLHLSAPDGARARSAVDFVTGNHANVLRPGELLRRSTSRWMPCGKRHAFRRSTLTHTGAVDRSS